MHHALRIRVLVLLICGGATSLFAQVDRACWLEQADEFKAESRFDSAARYYQLALKHWTPAGADSLPYADICHRLAEVHYELGHYDPALRLAGQALRVRECAALADTSFALANSYTLIGRIYRKKAAYEDARSCFEQALAIEQARRPVDPHRLSRCYSDFGNLHQNLGNYPEALDFFGKALALQVRVLGAEHPEAATLYHNRGIVYSRMGDYDEAVTSTLRGLEIRLKHFGQAHTETGRSYFMLSDYYRIKGDYERALDYNERAISVWQQVRGPDHIDAVGTYIITGIICAEKGDYDCALNYNRKALAIQEKRLGPTHPQTAGTMGNIAYIYQLKGDRAAALWHNQKALEMKEARLGKDHPWVAETCRSLGQLYLEEKAFAQALETFDRALAIDRLRLGADHATVAEDLRYLGDVHKAMAAPHRALEYYGQALPIYLRSFGEVHPYLGSLYHSMAESHRMMGHYDLAITSFQKGLAALAYSFQAEEDQPLPPLDKVIAKPVLRDLLALAGACYAQRHDSPQKKSRDLHTSLDLYLRAADLIDSMRIGFQHEGSKQVLAARAISVYEGGIAACYRLYEQEHDPKWLEQAFGLSERSKATLLYESMQESHARRFSGLPEALLEQERNLRLDLSFFEKSLFEETQLGASADKAKMARWEARWFDVKKSYDSLRVRLERDYPAYHQLKYSLHVPNVLAVQSLLPDDSVAFVEYFVGEQEIFAFVLRRRSADMIRIARPADLDSMIVKLRKGMQMDFFTQPAGDEDAARMYEKNAVLLYQSLFAPLKAIPGGLPARLVLAPDGVLGYLPFDALLTAAPAEKGKYRQYPYLLRDHQIAYAYAARLLTEQREKPARRHADKQWIAFSPHFESGKTGKAEAPDLREDLGFLAHSKPEVSGIRKLVGGDVFLDARATEAHFKQYAPQYRVVHISSHAQVNDDNPLYSRVAFAAASDSVEDGFLEVAELFNMRLLADMVVLSACETGGGTLYRGEGIVSLARGFTYAGARSILTTLWRVNDAATADIMQGFYAYLKAGMPKDQALRLAKKDYIDAQDNLGAHPFFWSGYVMMGDMAPLDLDTGRTAWTPWLLVLLAASSGLLAFRRRRKV